MRKPINTDPVRTPDTTIGNCSLFVSDESTELTAVNIVGDIDLSSAPKTYAAIWRASANGKRSIILNMDGLEFMDSSGLQTLLRLREKLRARKRNIYLVGAKPQIKKLFRLTGFDRLFSVFEDMDEARRLVGKASPLT